MTAVSISNSFTQYQNFMKWQTVKPVLSWHSKRRPKIGLRLMQVKIIAECWEQSAIPLTFIKLPLRAFCNTFDIHQAAINFVIKIFVLSNFEWPLKTGFTVCSYLTPMILSLM